MAIRECGPRAEISSGRAICSDRNYRDFKIKDACYKCPNGKPGFTIRRTPLSEVQVNDIRYGDRGMTR